jgi:hypothetical protein
MHATSRLVGVQSDQSPSDNSNYTEAIAMRRTHAAAKRHRDDLHEWTLYRQVRAYVEVCPNVYTECHPLHGRQPTVPQVQCGHDQHNGWG